MTGSDTGALPGPYPFETVAGTAPLRVVVVGAGAMGMAWLRAVRSRDDLCLVGIVDADVRHAKGAAIRLRCPEVAVGETLDDLAHIPAEVCVNVTPPRQHHAVSVQAIKRGLAVLSEKPCADSLRLALDLVEKAGAERRLLMVGQSRSYQPGLRRLKALSEDLGRLATITTEFRVAYRIGGFRAQMEHPLLFDMAVHSFDALRYLTSARPVRVFCDAYNPAGSWFAGAAAATVHVEMTGGTRYTYLGSWCFDGLPTSWSGRWHVSGENGTAAWDGLRDLVVDHGRDDPPRSVGDGPAGEDDPVTAVRRPLDDFVTAVRTGRRPWGEGSDNLMTLALAQAAAVSATAHQSVLVDDVIRSVVHGVRA